LSLGDGFRDSKGHLYLHLSAHERMADIVAKADQPAAKPLVSRKSSLEFLQKITEIHSLNQPV
jgi:hypothetical protein